MKFDQSKWKNNMKSMIDGLKKKQVIKKARITYQIFWNLALIFIIVLVLGGSDLLWCVQASGFGSWSGGFGCGAYRHGTQRG